MRTVYILIAAVAAAAMTALWVLHNQPQSGSTVATNTAFERIMQTGVIRCGYTAWDPMLKVDPTTKEVSGLAHDVMEAAAKYLDLKVEWTEEVGWGEFNQALQNQRFDVFCAGGTPNGERAKVTLTTLPFVYTDFGVIVRADDTRFDANAQRLNQPDIRFGQLDGTTAVKIIRDGFPAAKLKGYPETIPLSQMAIDIATGKLDASLIPITVMHLYNQQHPGALKRLEGVGANRNLPNVFFVSRHEPQLKHLLDTAITEVLDAGVVYRSIKQHQTAVGAYLLPAKPYQPEPIR